MNTLLKVYEGELTTDRERAIWESAKAEGDFAGYERGYDTAYSKGYGEGWAEGFDFGLEQAA